jgi:hypothetical protein
MIAYMKCCRRNAYPMRAKGVPVSQRVVSFKLRNGFRLNLVLEITLKVDGASLICIGLI